VRAAAALAILLLPRALSATLATEVHYVMGTYFRVTADHEDGEQVRRAMRACFRTARRLDERFSRFDAASELSRVNAAAAPAVPVSAEMAALLGRALELQVATDGAFDVSVGALTALWRSGGDWPRAETVRAARASAGPGSFHLEGGMLVRHPGVRIDLDGIAKGWAVDRCAAELRAAGITRALLDLGESSMYALGAPPGAPGWRVELRGLNGGTTVGTLQLRDQALSVSAVFGHESQVGGRRVGHVIDPRTGYPLATAALAAVVAQSATDAEALSKAVLVRGDPAMARHATGGATSGALLIRPDGVQRSGAVRFAAHRAPRVLAEDAEPLP
jgi:thiamine biosynthesis lipoprotein